MEIWKELVNKRIQFQRLQKVASDIFKTLLLFKFHVCSDIESYYLL